MATKKYEAPAIEVTLKPGDVFWLRKHYPNQWIACDVPDNRFTLSRRGAQVDHHGGRYGKRRLYINTSLLTDEVADLLTVQIMEEW